VAGCIIKRIPASVLGIPFIGENTVTNTNQQLIGAIYVRSASSLPEDVYDVDEQRFRIEKFALQDEAQIVKFYEDLGVSGLSDPQQRPGMSALLEDARKGEFNVLYIARLDRLSRRVEYMVDIVRQLRDAGVKIKVGEQGEVINEEIMELVENYTMMMK
jgi:site-specific DNA recombinase